VFDATNGLQLHKLMASDGALDDQLGLSIAIDGGIVAVGSPRDDDNGQRSGSVYLFDAVSGAEFMKIKPNDGAAFDEFGNSLAMDGGRLVVGAWSDGDSGGGAGSAYVFDVATGQQLHKLLASDGGPTDYFGSAVAIDGTTIIVGAYSSLNNGGSAYLFDAVSGAQVRKFVATDIASNDAAGTSVGVHGGVVVVGAPMNDDGASNSGSAYLFEAGTGLQIAKLLASDAALGVQFGQSVAIQGGRVFVGSHLDDDNGFTTGSAYRFTVPGSTCAPDLNSDGVLDFFDVQAFLGAYSSQSDVADWNDDSIFDFFDVQQFLAAMSAGCG
jgi:hypothetical protein